MGYLPVSAMYTGSRHSKSWSDTKKKHNSTERYKYNSSPEMLCTALTVALACVVTSAAFAGLKNRFFSFEFGNFVGVT